MGAGFDESALFALPSWLTCSGPGFHPVWTEFRSALSRKKLEGSNASNIAFRIISQWRSTANAWIAELHNLHLAVASELNSSKGLDELVRDDPRIFEYKKVRPRRSWPSVELGWGTPLACAGVMDASSETLAGLEGNSDAYKVHLRHRHSAELYGGFCAIGYAAASALWASTLALRGHIQRALSHLQLAKASLGVCSELDFLDSALWGLSSTDLDLMMLRVEAALGKRQTWPDSRPLLSALSSEVETDSWEQLSRKSSIAASNVQAHLWHGLHTFSQYRLEVQHTRALGVASGALEVAVSKGLPPVVHGKPMGILLFGSPLHYVRFVIYEILNAYPGLHYDHDAVQLKVYSPSPLSVQQVQSSYDFSKYYIDDPFLKQLELKGHFCCELSTESALENFDRLLLAFSMRAISRGATVSVCSAPLWLCMRLRTASALPLLTLSLCPHHLLSPSVEWNGREGDADMYQKLTQGMFDSGPPLFGDERSSVALFREDFGQVYVNFLYPALGASRASLLGPFLHYTSLYVGQNVRYSGAQSQTVLCIRDGGFGKFYGTIRGQFWRSALKQVTPLLRRQIVWSTGKTAYEAMALHAMAVFFPGLIQGKLILKDLWALEMPTILPSKALFANVLNRVHNQMARYECDEDTASATPKPDTFDEPAPWALALCSWLRVAYRAEFSSFYRHPFLLNFDSFAHLVFLMVALEPLDLLRLSQAMHDFNRHMRSTDTLLWRETIEALACTKRVGRRDILTSGKDRVAAARPRFGAILADPQCIFGVLGETNDSVKFCCAASCGACPGPYGCSRNHSLYLQCCPAELSRTSPACTTSTAPCVMIEDG